MNNGAKEMVRLSVATALKGALDERNIPMLFKCILKWYLSGFEILDKIPGEKRVSEHGANLFL